MLMAALFGAVFAVVGGALGKWIGGAFKLQGRGAQTAVAVGAAAFAVLSRPALEMARTHGVVSRPETPASAIDADLATLPLFQTVKAYYPDVYGEMAGALKFKLDSGAGKLAAMNAARPMLTRLMDEKFKLANDANANALLRVVQEEGRAAQARSADTCFQFATGVTYDFIPTEVFARELLAREQAAGEAMLKQAATAPQSPPANQDTVKADFAAVMTGAARGMSESELIAVRKMSDPATLKSMTAVEKDISCRFTLRMFDEFLKLPPERSAAAYKYLRSP